jgi:hypothetical protein
VARRTYSENSFGREAPAKYIIRILSLETDRECGSMRAASKSVLAVKVCPTRPVFLRFSEKRIPRFARNDNRGGFSTKA